MERPGASPWCGERFSQLGQDAERLFGTLDQGTAELQGALQSAMGERPYALLAAAAAVGYVLGGGLASPLTRLLLLAGGRIGVEVLWRDIGARLLAAGDDGPTRQAAPADRPTSAAAARGRGREPRRGEET